MRYDAFISYRRDSGFLMAQVIYDRLEKQGIRCFLDFEELRSGKFDEKILSVIQEAHTFILILPKKALDRCVNEDDWVRREILEAVKYNKNIIPVMYDGFSWPKRWKAGIPEEIKSIKTENGVSGTQEYLSAMIDKIISFMPQDIVKERIIKEIDMKSNLDTVSFFKAAFEKLGDDVCVDMAFHAGAEWRQETGKMLLLKEMINKNIKVRVLANSSEVVSDITDRMFEPLKDYKSYEDCLKSWHRLSLEYPDIISLRIPKVPLLHRLYIIRGSLGGVSNVKYYTYGNSIPENDFRFVFADDTPEYKLYSEEFDFLWNDSWKYEDVFPQ